MPNLLNKSQTKILKSILNNPEINLRGVIEKTRLSPNSVSERINYFVKLGILLEKKFKKNKTYLRLFRINPDSQITKNLLSIMLEEEKNNFFEKYPKLQKSLTELSKLKTLSLLIIYGSYSRLSANKESDLDLLLVGKRIDSEKVREILIGTGIEPSIKIETMEQFGKRKEDALHTEILKEGVIVKGIATYWMPNIRELHF